MINRFSSLLFDALAEKLNEPKITVLLSMMKTAPASTQLAQVD